MKKGMKIAIVSGLILAGVSSYGMNAYADKDGDDCGWKRGGQHSAMMRGGHFGGPMGFFGMMRGEDRNYSTEEIRILAQAFLLRLGNDNLQVGDITVKSDESYMVRVETKDGSLVKEVEVSKKNGMPSEMMKRQARFHKADQTAD
ncbi:hypothetical protein DFP90_10378 [Aestuariispira insulae]|uniref:YpeB-like protein with protease inhibitory function n=2 Tax=Aestuariispira insulae TaxID=1461337 RepID=A0A3D9HP56_9PROT|nr:hypothetical protein DFP90_10378 [Aestuariispira insulae]